MNAAPIHMRGRDMPQFHILLGNNVYNLFIHLNVFHCQPEPAEGGMKLPNSMNKLSIMKAIVNRTALALLSLFISFIALAQNEGGGGKVDVDVNLNKNDQWYQQPWVWIVGGAVFILLLVALLRGGKKSEA
jgi:hypothetical protein